MSSSGDLTEGEPIVALQAPFKETEYQAHFNDTTQYEVRHCWKKLPKIGHHSHLEMRAGNQVVTVGMVNWKNPKTGEFSGIALILIGKKRLISPQSTDYYVSISYWPNPLKGKSGKEIKAALSEASKKCSDDYDSLKNNCQKFARIVMTELGARHTPIPFHF